jgi:hypothetical protein
LEKGAKGNYIDVEKGKGNAVGQVSCTAAAEGKDIVVGQGKDTAAVAVQSTVAVEGTDTAAAEGTNTAAAEGKDTSAAPRSELMERILAGEWSRRVEAE